MFIGWTRLRCCVLIGRTTVQFDYGPDVPVDINVNNVVGVVNSRLVAIFMDTDYRVRPLM